MTCRACGHENRPGRKFCTQCGVGLAVSCPACSQEVAPDEKFCGNCGAALGASHPPSLPSEAGTHRDQARDDGERRQITVLFADLVGSTELSHRLDIEEYRELLRAYDKAVSEVVVRFGGYLAHYLGDGILAYFGWPEAHDNEAERAVRAALAILDAIERMNREIGGANPLAVRIGVHTGAVVMGKVGGSGRQEVTALGETPNVAARVQAVAPPNCILITPATHRLVSGLFVVEDAGAHVLKGIAQPMELRRVRRPSGVRSGLQGAAARGLTLFIGREHELQLIGDRWELAREGKGQLVLISGEAGIGKSRLVKAFEDQIAEHPH
ncbi:MAG TPA: adenylate/guanylate cyclase domain-containing protein, partial [Candidatus Binataceae bacterium]|nr:adenylate/guanylate cyclase domain-containing protein [Candidatus Binataceae bacterium]